MVRQINWSGYIWNVRSGTNTSPGPNNYSDSTDNVWIDTNNNLHLKITYRNGKWYCAEVDAVKSLGYGTYATVVVSDPSILNKNVVGGLFYYLDDQNELDVEFSTWGKTGINNTQYTVWTPSGSVESPRYETNKQNTTHKLNYNSNKISFESIGIGSWIYPGTYIPKLGGQYIFDLWLFKGQPPSDGKEQELILSSFNYSTSSPIFSSIAIVPTSANVSIGKTVQLTLTCKDQINNTITCPTIAWSSSDISIATVDSNGLVTGVSVGTANITASSGTITSNTSTIIVITTPVLTSITIAPTSANINIGATQQLTATCLDQNNNTITCPTLNWLSSNVSVATVSSSGIVTGVDTGTVNITVSSGTIMSNVSAITVIPLSTNNKLLNPGFELSTIKTGMPDNWETYQSPSTPLATFTYPEAGNNGSKAVGIAQTTKGLEQDWIQHVTSVVGSANYEVNGDISTNNVVAIDSSLGAVIGVDWFNSSGTFISSKKAVHMTGTNSWIRLKATITAPSNAAKANFFVALIGTGKALFDNVSFCQGNC